MNIGLDFDDTYTRAPELWDKVIALWRNAGCLVYIVTWRFDAEGSMAHGGLFGDESPIVRRALDGKVDGMYFTGRKAKEKYMYSQGIRIDVWVDDNPLAVVQSMQGH